MPFDDAGFLAPIKIVNKGRVQPVVETDAGRLLKRLAHGRKWIRGTYRMPDPEGGVRYCLVGAIWAEWPIAFWKRRHIYDRIKQVTGMNVIAFNDSRTSWSQVAKVLRKLQQEEIDALR